MASEPVPDAPGSGASGPDFLTAFNTARFAEAEAMLRPCLDIPRWCNEIAASRPFTTAGELLSFAELAAPDFTEAEVDGALAHHPRIGEQPEDTTGAPGTPGPGTPGTGAPGTPGPSAAFSRSEQASVSGLACARDRLGAGNRAYEDRFGRVFLIRAAGRSAGEILAALEDRLQHTAEEELPVIAAQLRDIAILRLEGLLRP